MVWDRRALAGGVRPPQSWAAWVLRPRGRERSWWPVSHDCFPAERPARTHGEQGGAPHGSEPKQESHVERGFLIARVLHLRPSFENL